MPNPLHLHPAGAPGSLRAQAAGCLCPIADNGHGAGAFKDADGQPVFYVEKACPIHANGVDTQPIYMQEEW